jgi:phage shock protein A
MTFDPRPHLDSIAQDIENEATFDCPAMVAQRIRLAGQEIDRLRADLAKANARIEALESEASTLEDQIRDLHYERGMEQP